MKGNASKTREIKLLLYILVLLIALALNNIFILIASAVLYCSSKEIFHNSG